MNNVLEVKNLSKTYYTKKEKVHAIEDVSFKIKEGEFVAIVGSSGCGKSTLLSILANLDKQTKGEIIYNKDNFTIGYMLQNDALFDWLSILDNSLLGLDVKKEKTEENIKYTKNKALVDSMSAAVILQDYLDSNK